MQDIIKQPIKNLYALMSLFILLITIFTAVMLGLNYGQGNMSQNYFILYMVLCILTIILTFIAFISDFGKKIGILGESLFSDTVFIFERSALRPLSLIPAAPIVTMITVTLVVVALVSSTGFSLYSPPGPYSQDIQFSQEQLSQESAWRNFLTVALIPAITEEAVVFFGTLASIFFIFLMIKAFLKIAGKQDLPKPFFVGLYWLLTIIIVGFYSFLFSIGHGRYGGNQVAFFTAFAFEFIVQMLNHLTGGFISWMPHMAHNLAVMWTQTYSFVVFSWGHYMIPLLSIERVRFWYNGKR